MSKALEMGLDLCLKYPYHVDTEGRKDDWHYTPKDNAEHAALAVIWDFCDRRGIKRGFENIDGEVRKEIVENTAEIIRQLMKEPHDH